MPQAPGAGRCPAVLSLVPPHPAAPTPTPFPPKLRALQAPRQRVWARPALAGVGARPTLCELLGAGPGSRAVQFAANQRDTQAVLPRGRFWCRRREAGYEALVSLLGSPHPGPSNAGPEVSLGSPGEPPGSEGPGQAEPRPRPAALPSLHACGLEGTRAPQAQTPEGSSQPPYRDRSEHSVIQNRGVIFQH